MYTCVHTLTSRPLDLPQTRMNTRLQKVEARLKIIMYSSVHRQGARCLTLCLTRCLDLAERGGEAGKCGGCRVVICMLDPHPQPYQGLLQVTTGNYP
jgi:hypothetical protein